ncbi:hypothetical protein MKX01_021324 [Papaver californicum]|nr:hypothetical protein MKX01_021324 [Papaver californicum]
MELVDYSIEEGLEEEDEQFVCSSIACGGPITFLILLTLETELCVDSFHLCEEDLSVDELKIYTEEELVEKALQEAFQNYDEKEPQVLEDLSNRMSKDDLGTSCEFVHLESSEKRINTSPSYESLNGSLVQVSNPDSSGILVERNSKKSRKRGRKFDRDCRAAELEMRSSNTREHMDLSSQEVVLCTQEFLVLGKQTLAELRDQIYCSTDQLMQKEKQSDPSGYFLIEDVFCNDLRDPDAVDYSEPIFDWLRNSKKEALEKWDWILSGPSQPKEKALFGDTKTSHLPNFKVVDMHKVRFCDLSFRLGAGYIYCHQGIC